MSEIKLKILNHKGHALAVSNVGTQAILTYACAYSEGDLICLEASESDLFCEIRLEDSMLPAIIYLREKTIQFHIPFGEKRISYSPKSFTGTCHLISAQIIEPPQLPLRRNLALNPYDQHGDTGFFPHASANIETRGESVFAARNTIDGIYANHSHGEYPYQSWGINRRPDAELKIELGLPCIVDEVRLTLRADFPHDNYWTQATLIFSNGETETLALVKTPLPQIFRFPKIKTEWVILKDLMPSSEPSPFPALTQFEIWGTFSES